ncbi:MAG: TerB family tellurite resistance protein [Muribaculaceae bacterium]|nr:TerB family tellurite resistance protein [Muribaculaceae bacterium]
MNYNGIQMAAVIKAANAMIAADGRIDQAETQLLSRELINFGVEPQQLPQLLELSKVMEPTTMLATLAAMNESQKKYVSGFLATIMISDGDIDDSEMKLWQLTSTLMGCPTMTLQEALEYWGNN